MLKEKYLTLIANILSNLKMSREFCYMEELKKSKSKNRTAEKSIGKRTNEKKPYSLLSEIQ